jgi:prepilin-type N-terminal cleavage/methylation domain-containing protein
MNSRSGKGFTVIEILVAAGIFALLSAVVLADLRTGGRIQILQAAADELASRIKQAQDMAYSSAKQFICSTDGNVCRSGSACDAAYPTNCSEQYVTQYGVAFEIGGSSSRYLIGADYSGLGDYAAAEAVPNGLVTLPSNIVISSVTPVTAAPGYSLLFQYNSANASPFVPCSVNCTTIVTLRDNVTNTTRAVVYRRQTGLVTTQ